MHLNLLGQDEEGIIVGQRPNRGEEAEGYEDGQIIGEVQQGFIIGERVLRPALVRVAKAPTLPPAPSEEDQDNDKVEE